MASRVMKRLIDLSVSLALILALAPLFLIVAVLIYLDEPGPVFYVQERVGKNGRHFDFLKFRSMVLDADRLRSRLETRNESADGVIFKIRDDPRITKIGRLLRRSSIDELPQLFNVLKGDMSLVGPRPPVPAEVAKYGLEERKRLHVTPGITGIWQVSGRSEIPFKQQVQLDLLYIRSQGILQDLWILLKTVPAVLLGRGAY